MARKFYRGEVIPSRPDITTKLGAQNAPYKDTELGKPVKASTTVDSGMLLTAAGNPIEGFIQSVEAATSDGYGIGGVQQYGTRTVTFDGLQATPGTGTVALGDYVVTGTVVAQSTALTVPPKVCKATNQPGAVPADLTAAGQQALNAVYAWRVVSLGTAGTGAVGTVGVIERVNG